MFKFVVLAMAVCAANAGLIAGGYGHGVVAAPALAVAHAPVAVAHAATSYQNNNQISLHPSPVVATHAVAAPVAVAHAAPIAVAHAPVAAVGLGLGGYGGLGGLGHGLLH